MHRDATPMKLRMSKVLRFWVECEYQDDLAENDGRTKTQPIASILGAFEEAGDAMRRVNANGQIAWKATPKMLRRLADAEREAKDDLAD
jgi:hypothetical protein